MRSYRGTRQFCDRWWCPTLDWRKESATKVHTSLMAGKSMVWTSPVAPLLWCAGQRKSAAAHTQFTHPLFAPLNTPFFTINCIKHFHTLLFLPLWLLHHQPPRLPDCSRHFLWIQQIIQTFLYDCIKYPDTFCKCFSDASIVSISISISITFFRSAFEVNKKANFAELFPRPYGYH